MMMDNIRRNRLLLVSVLDTVDNILDSPPKLNFRETQLL
jgi:hypothetical protein